MQQELRNHRLILYVSGRGIHLEKKKSTAMENGWKHKLTKVRHLQAGAKMEAGEKPGDV